MWSFAERKALGWRRSSRLWSGWRGDNYEEIERRQRLEPREQDGVVRQVGEDGASVNIN